MKTPSPSACTYLRLGYLALAHAGALVVLTGFMLQNNGFVWLPRLWIALVTLWFLWPIVLALHPGRSVLRLGVFALLGAILLWPSLRWYDMIAPEAFGLPEGARMNPPSAWMYFSAYRAGRAEAQKDVADGILAIEEYGFGAGHGGQILRERYQIEIRAVAQCVVDDRILGHAAGYNKVSGREIDRRFSRSAIEAAREESDRLDEEERERQKQYGRDLAKRLSSFPSDSKITLASAQPWIDDHRQLDSETEEELRRSVRELERFVSEAVPKDAPAFELHISADLRSTERPQFQTSASSSVPRPVYDSIYQNLPNLPLPHWSRDRLAVSLDFQVRDPR